MALKEELEILRGEPIEVFTGDPMDIPCIETSDPEKLCKYPVVSVQMITYNHEPYIRQAIEGVMMQKTDFEFELVIGEDASTDKTREICFEYQKKYPDRIRVLWWHENLYRNPHPAGGNGARTRVHCRGEFIALCEGDDYWIDPLKLQKQVDVMRRNPDVGFCFTGARIFHGEQGEWEEWNLHFQGFSPGKIPSSKYVLWTLFGRDPRKFFGPEIFVMTATTFFRTATLKAAKNQYEIFGWKLTVGDAVVCIGSGAVGAVYYLPDETAVYRQMPTGATRSPGSRCGIDTLLVRMFFASCLHGLALEDTPERWRDWLCSALIRYARYRGAEYSHKYMKRCLKGKMGRHLFLRIKSVPFVVLLLMGCMSDFAYRQCCRWMFRLFRANRVPGKTAALYRELEN